VARLAAVLLVVLVVVLMWGCLAAQAGHVRKQEQDSARAADCQGDT
jgi:hypothetical protein